MIIIETLQEYENTYLQLPQPIGFVPTMGALHQGHISLIEKANQENKTTICSIFVNPTQFNNPQDLEKYPRTIEKDIALLKKANCSVLFLPNSKTMYPDGFIKIENFDYKGLDLTMEASKRPGHFDGVITIVKKLFEIIKPQNAYFGEKDFQQLSIVQLLCNTYKIPVNIVPCAIVREPDGLAMSSRNVRLNEEERSIAAHIPMLLKKGIQLFKENKNSFEIINSIEMEMKKYKLFTLEYFCITNQDTLNENKIDNNKPLRAFIAANIGNVRLIDNMEIS
jgi:pantoate--beta-alanine ligase